MHDPILHIINVAGDESIKALVDATLRPVTDMVSRQIAKYFGLTLDADTDAESMRVEVDRIKETMATFQAAMQDLQRDRSTDWMRIAEESREPSAAKFVRRAVDVSANTTLESKRFLAGLLIAKRLQTATDSDDEILLRRALDAIEDLTENQLQLLAAASLVQSPRTPWTPTSETPSRAEAESALSPLLPIARRFIDTLNFGEDQFGTLASVGAIRLHDDTGSLIVSESAEPFDAWMQIRGVSPYDGIEGELGTNESHEAFRRRFPAISTLRALGAKPEGSSMHQGRRLDGVIMTPLGWTIAQLVLDQLLGQSQSPLPLR